MSKRSLMRNEVDTLVLFFLSLMFACPVIAFMLNYALRANLNAAARYAGYSIGLGLMVAIGLLFYISRSLHAAIFLSINLNAVNLLLCSLVLLVSFIVHRFSLRYMHGDRLYRRFFLLLSALTLTAMAMVLADNLFAFWGAWSLSNLFLVLLMVHKKEWTAAKNSGLLALYTLASGSICLLIAFVLLNQTFSSSSIYDLTILPPASHSFLLSVAMGLILITALTQSGLFPFHRWLISSLNSPTPVSALMHAGLVNGGGILVVKFAPLMMLYPGLMMALFLIGSLSAMLGTVWKLMQHDIKKMLACSTMAQMGFMMMQCGVGLFAAAIAHLCWHGLFKAYLFLSSGSAVKQTKAEPISSKTSPTILMMAMFGGIAAMCSFAVVTHKPISVFAASTFVLFFVFIAGTQFLLTWIRSHQGVLSVLLGLMLASFSGLMYGLSIQIIQWLIPDMSMLKAPQLSLIHWVIMFLFEVLWVVFNLGVSEKIGQSRFGCWLYMNLYNASQPSRKTVTATRSDYLY